MLLIGYRWKRVFWHTVRFRARVFFFFCHQSGELRFGSILVPFCRWKVHLSFTKKKTLARSYSFCTFVMLMFISSAIDDLAIKWASSTFITHLEVGICPPPLPRTFCIFIEFRMRVVRVCTAHDWCHRQNVYSRNWPAYWPTNGIEYIDNTVSY